MPPKATPPERKSYTVAEANATLPEVRRLLAELKRAVTGLDELKTRLTGGAPGQTEVPKPEPDTQVDPHHLLLVGIFHHSVGRLNELSIEVKDVQKGLIDFPCRAGGEDLLLCWQDGEESVRFFHDLESGFAGRKPIDELPGVGVLPAPREDDGGEEEG